MFKNFNQSYKNNFTIYMNNVEFPLSPYVENLLLEIPLDNKASIIVYPGGREINTMLIPYISLFSRYKNYLQKDSDITDELGVGDLIYFRDGLCRFLGKKLFKDWGNYPKDWNNNYAVKIEYADGIDLISERDFNEITKYTGDAKMLSKLKNQKCNSNKTDLLTSFDLSSSFTSTRIKSSVLYVKNKSDVDNIISNTSAEYGQVKGKTLSNVVPLRYWSSCEKHINYPGNKHGLTPVVNMTCSLENALNLLYDQERIELVIIDLSDFRGLDFNLLEQVIDLSEAIELIILLPFDKYKDFNNYFKDVEFNNVIVTKAKASEYIDNSLKLPLQVQQMNLIYNYVNREVKFKIIEENERINFREINSSLKALLSGGSADEETTDLINRSFGLLSSLKSYIGFDNSKSDENCTFIKQQLNDIEEEISKVIMDDSFFSVNRLQSILDMLKSLVREVISENKIAKEIENILKYSSNKSILFVVQNNRVKSVLDAYIKGKFRNKKIHCKTISKVDVNIFYDTTYILGVIPNKTLSSKLFSLMVSSRIEFIYYESYLNYIKYLYNCNVIDLLKEECIPASSNHELSTTDSNGIEDYDLIAGLTKLVNDYRFEDIFRIYFGDSDDKSNVRCDYLINFNEFIGVFKKDYKVYRVNLEEKRLDDVKVSSLSISDEILILNDNFKSGAFIEEIIEALLQDDKFHNQYSELIEFSKLWKKVLLDYLDKNNLTPSQLHKQMKDKGLKKTYPTFRNWINNDYIVGPDQESDYELIFSLDPNEYSKWKAVYEACNKVRSLHIKLRHDVGKMIVESYFNDDVVSDNLSYLEIDFMSKVTICEVASIDKGEFKVPNYMVNSIIRKEA